MVPAADFIIEAGSLLFGHKRFIQIPLVSQYTFLGCRRIKADLKIDNIVAEIRIANNRKGGAGEAGG
ncbi:hypothetical protein D3C86_1747070 [compost metagenome]